MLLGINWGPLTFNNAGVIVACMVDSNVERGEIRELEFRPFDIKAWAVGEEPSPELWFKLSNHFVLYCKEGVNEKLRQLVKKGVTPTLYRKVLGPEIGSPMSHQEIRKAAERAILERSGNLR
jgi:hypothetical protein